MRLLYPLDRLGWPIERIQGRPITNTIRLLLHTRKITTKRPAIQPYLPNAGEPVPDGIELADIPQRSSLVAAVQELRR